MQLALGSDHAGFQAKSALINFLQENGYTVSDFGCDSKTPVDYPDYAIQVTRAVQAGQAEFGILICGTGIGMSIVANKVIDIRAALCYTPELARLSRQHNNANILCLGGRFQTIAEIKEISMTWLETPFEGGRHLNRVNKIHTLTGR